MHQSRRNFLIFTGGILALVTLALLLSGSLPFLPAGLRAALNLSKTASIAGPYWYTTIGASYAPYPGQTSCYNHPGGSCGNSNNCQGNPIYGAIDLTPDNGVSGSSGYVYANGTAGNGGTAPALASNTASITLNYACTPGRSIDNQHEECHTQCGWGCSTSCGCYGDAGSYQTFNTSLTVTGPSGATVITSSSPLYGSQSVQPGGAAGTYDAGQVVTYSLSCSGTATPATATVVMGPTVTNTSITASVNPVRQGLDQTILTINASQASADTCQLIGPAGLMKSYSGTSVTNDIVTVGPLQATSTYQIKCLGPEGFNSRASVIIGVETPPNLSITANNTPVLVSIPAGSSADIRWSSSNQLANSCSVTYTATGGTCAAGAKSIATEGAYGTKAFTVGSGTYLAVANAYDGTTYNVNSKIYKWQSGGSCFGDGTTCGVAYQSIATNGAAMWESFVIGSDTYLSVANSRNDTTRAVNSKIYKWTSSGAGCPAGGGLGNGTSCNSSYQSIATNGAVDLKPVVVGSDTYLAAANYRNDVSYEVNSNIYRWMSSGASCPAGGGFGNGTTCGAVLQAIATKGAYRMESFVVGGEAYLGVTNAFDGGTIGYNMPSYIFKYTASGTNCPAGGGFGNGNHHTCGTPYQTLNTSGAYGFKFFTIGNVSYLAVANSYDGTSYNINSKIYKWMTSGNNCPTLGGTGGFGDGTTCGSAFQLIPTKGATSINTFVIGSNTYLVAANAYDGLSYNVSSSIYQWVPSSQCFGNNATCGVALQSINTSGAAWFEPITISGSVYLAIANYYNGTTRNINSTVMQWSPNGCGDAQFGTPTVWTGDQGPLDGNPTGFFSGARLYTLSCKWLDGTTASSTNVNVVVLPQLTLSANGSTTNPVYITPSTSALVQWSSLNVQSGSCSVSNSGDSTVWSADNNTAGYSSPVLSNGQQITYTLACLDLLGQPTNKTMAVIAATPVPLLSNLSITASRVLKGARPTIVWNAQNLSSGLHCSITPTLQGGSSASSWGESGTSWSSPLGGALGPVITVATTFRLTCVNNAGDSASVSAIANLIPSFKEI